MASIQKRILFGFIAGAISVVTFHAGAWALLHVLAVPGFTMPAPYPMDAIPPFGVPRELSLAFWGGLWGALFGAVWRGGRATYWYGGLFLGLAAVLAGFFIVAPIKGNPIGGGWVLTNWLRSLFINGTWGLGVGLLLMALLGTSTRAEEDYANR